jgi:peptidyl-prolyl cis-trans isomerase C
MNPRRVSIPLALLGALLVLGAGPAEAKKPAPRAAARSAAVADSNRVLVRIGREAITRADVERRLAEIPEAYRATYATPEGRRQLLDRMIEERVWMMAATRAGVPQRPEVQRQLQQQRRDLLIRAYVNEMMSANPAPSDSESRAFYDAHSADFTVPATVTVRHIQSRTESDARRVLAWARGKQDWNKLAQRYSTDTLTRAAGGALGSVTREGVFASIGTQRALADSAFALGEGKIGGPYKTDRGWHVLKVESVKPESLRPFEQVRGMIQRQLASQRSQEFYRSRLDAERRRLGVQPDSAAIKGFLSMKKTAREMFKEAQEAGPAARRIELYQRLLQEYPESEVSAQAQFMIGFINSEEVKDYAAAEKAFRELLRRYPKAELAPSAQWMVDHMRNEEAPSFMNLEADSSGRTAAPKGAGRSSSGKP